MKRLVWVAVAVGLVVGGFEFINWYYEVPETEAESLSLDVGFGPEAVTDGPAEEVVPDPPPLEEGTADRALDPGPAVEEVMTPAEPPPEEAAAGAVPMAVTGEATSEKSVEPEEPAPVVGAIGRSLLNEEDPERRLQILRRLIAENPNDPGLPRAVEAEAERARLEAEKAIEWEALSFLFFRSEKGEKRDRAKARLDTLIDDIIFSRRRGPASELYQIQGGDSLKRIAARFNCPVDLLQRINGIANPNLIRQGDRIKVIDGHREIVVPVEPGDTLEDLSYRHGCSVGRIRELNGFADAEVNLGETIRVLVGAYHIRVVKGEFTLTVTHNGRYVRQYAVGIGADDRTPIGKFSVRVKLVNPAWSPPGQPTIPAGDPRNILGSRWIGFETAGSASGIGIHGTTEPETIGTESSAGCIRLHNKDVEELASLTPRGTRVTIID